MNQQSRSQPEFSFTDTFTTISGTDIERADCYSATLAPCDDEAGDPRVLEGQLANRVTRSLSAGVPRSRFEETAELDENNSTVARPRTEWEQSTPPTQPLGSHRDHSIKRPEKGLDYALKNLFFSGRLRPANGEYPHALRGAPRYQALPGTRCLISTVEDSLDTAISSTSTDTELLDPFENASHDSEIHMTHMREDQTRSTNDQRANPRLPVDARVQVTVFPMDCDENVLDAPGSMPLTPIQGSVLMMNENGVSLSLDAPLMVGAQVVLQFMHPTLNQPCTIPSTVRRREQSRNLWLIACAFQNPLSEKQVEYFSRQISSGNLGRALD